MSNAPTHVRNLATGPLLLLLFLAPELHLPSMATTSSTISDYCGPFFIGKYEAHRLPTA